MVVLVLVVASCLMVVWSPGEYANEPRATSGALDAAQLRQAAQWQLYRLQLDQLRVGTADTADWQRALRASRESIDQPTDDPLLLARRFSVTPDLLLPAIDSADQLADARFVSRPMIDGHRASTTRALSRWIDSSVRSASLSSRQLFGFALDRCQLRPTELVAINNPLPLGRLALAPGDRIAMRTTLPAPRVPLGLNGSPSLYDLFDSMPLALNTPFARATELEALLDDLLLEPAVSLWSHDALRTLDQLTDADEFRRHSSRELLARLIMLADEAGRTADLVGDESLAVRLRQARWGLLRRGGCWSAVEEMRRVETTMVASVPCENRPFVPGAVPAKLVAHSSERPQAAPLPDDWSALTRTIEQYESTREPQLAQAVADRWRTAAKSSDPRERVLAEQLEVHYRNANLRVAVSRDLLLRLIEPNSTRSEEVNDTIVGTPVRGTATSTSHVQIELLEDPSAWRIGLQLTGETHSHTWSFSPPVTIESVGTTRFAGSKQLLFDRLGAHMGATRTVAEAENRLVDIQSKYDNVPLMGRVVDNRAREEYAKRQQQAQREVEQKAASRVSDECDTRIEQAIRDAEARYERELTTRLDRLGMKLDTLQLETTRERLIGRFRVARPDQLAAHTPRPRALAESVASLQLHESLVTNLAAGFDLDGKRMTVAELREHLTVKFPERTIAEADGDIDGEATIVQFADTGAVVVKFVDGQARLQLSVAELRHERTSHRNFRVHVYFEPVVDGLSARLVHAAGPFIEGQIRNSERFRLQAILGRVVGDDSDITIVPASDDSRLEGLTITQMVIDDGWLGWSIGPVKLGCATVFERR